MFAEAGGMSLNSSTFTHYNWNKKESLFPTFPYTAQVSLIKNVIYK